MHKRHICLLCRQCKMYNDNLSVEDIDLCCPKNNHIWSVNFTICRKKVAACAKHYVGDGGTVKGIDENNTLVDMHDLFSIHMAGYYNSVIRGVATVMASYSSLNGVRMHANRDMITGFLKKTLHFKVLFHFSCIL